MLAFCGLLLVISAKASDGDDLRGSDILELSDLVRAEERRVQELQAQVADLDTELEEFAAAKGDSQTEEINRQIEELMPDAGLTSVEGPALSVTLDDAPLPGNVEEQPDEFNIEDYLVHQQDLEGVVNALWAGGAEALTVMDQRVVSTSTIRCVGSVLLLHGRTYYPPYTITAIGDTDAMRDALEAAPAVREYRHWADTVGLRYDVAGEGTVAMPGYTGSIGGGTTS